MHRIDHSTAATVLPNPEAVGPKPNGFFTPGNPGGGVPATILKYDFMNTVQEEICYVIEQSGITLSKTVRTQLFAALQAMGAKGYAHTQGSPSASWNVSHNMGSVNHHVTVRDGNGKIHQPDWDQSTIGTNSDTLVFNEPVTGSVYVSL